MFSNIREGKGYGRIMIESKFIYISKWAVEIVLVLSSCIFAFHKILIDHYDKYNIFLTEIIAFICVIIFLKRTKEENYNYIKKNIYIDIIVLMLSFFVIYQEFLTKGMACREEVVLSLPVNLFRLRWYLLSVPFLFYFCIWLCRKTKQIVEDILRNLDTTDKKLYIGLTVFFSILILLVYIISPMWYTQYDQVYSIDSGWCFYEIYPKITYYDIRHPILGEIAFVIWSIIYSILKIFAPDNLCTALSAVLIQWVNLQFLLITGLMLKIMTKSRQVFLLYMVSFSTLLFSLSLEKYQMCVFFVVLYVYLICREKKKSTDVLIIATGIMPTNGFIGLLELFQQASVISKIKKIIRILITGIVVIVFTGRGHLLNLSGAYAEIKYMKDGFGNSSLTITERLISVMKMIQSAFIALTSEVSDSYLWKSVTAEVSFICVLILFLVIIGAICNWKEKFVRICSLWSAFSVILFVILNWAPYESPLFAILFSWAEIPLFKLGIDWVNERMRIEKKPVYGFIIIVMLVINISALMDIQKYLLSLSM